MGLNYSIGIGIGIWALGSAIMYSLMRLSTGNRVATHVITVINTVMTVFLAGYNPYLMVWWYMTKYTGSMLWRFQNWRKERRHYYMTEFCYFANWLMVGYFLVRIGDTDGVSLQTDALIPITFKTLFAIATGPFPMASFTFGDKLVFSSLQYMISMMIHFGTALVFWSVRWHGERWFPEVGVDVGEFSWSKIWSDTKDNVYLVAVPYLGWMIIYYVSIFWCLRQRIKEKGNIILYEHFKNKPNHPMTRLIGGMSDGHLKELTYMLVHCVSMLPTLMVSAVAWNNYYLHTAGLFLLGIGSVYLSATYQEHLRRKRMERQEKEKKQDKTE